MKFVLVVSDHVRPICCFPKYRRKFCYEYEECPPCISTFRKKRFSLFDPK